MGLYAFELGRKKELCFAELISVLGKDNFRSKDLDCAIFELDLKNPTELQNRLGGTIKIIEILTKTDKRNILQDIEKILETELKDLSGKIIFSISTLNFKNPREINIKQTLNFSKIFLKKLGLSCRFVNKAFTSPKPSTIYKARVLEKGMDLNILKSGEGISLGKTVSIQNIDSYSIRDYEKPARDAKIGMLPPKLAQIMINLAGTDTKTVYDPFCGTGTVLTESLLMGKKAIGSDMNPKMVEATTVNCKWLCEKFRVNGDWRAFERDARFLDKNVLPEKIDAVVTEGYLGPALFQFPFQNRQEEIFRELANLHLNWLNSIGRLIKKGTPLIMCVTAFRDKERIIHLPRFQEIAETAGFKVNLTFSYDREDQFVARDIKVLEKL